MKPGQSIFAADLCARPGPLMALDWIASAEVLRRYPDAIYRHHGGKAALRAVAAARQCQGRSADRRGGAQRRRHHHPATWKISASLPKLVGAGAPPAAADLVDAVQAHRAIAARIAAYERHVAAALEPDPG